MNTLPGKPGWVASLVLAGIVAGLGDPVGAQQAPRRGFSIKITEPADQDVILGKIRIAAEVKIEDPSLVDRVEFLVGDDVIFVDRERPYECFHDLGEESRTWVLRVVAYHKEGVSVSDAVVTRKLAFLTVERVNRVVLWMSARDSEGKFLTDLRREEVRVLENGVAQEILDIHHEERPITLAILMDTSGSMLEEIKEVHKAASSFVETLRAQDQALVIDFNDKVYLIQDLTADQELLKQAITSTEALGGTALYDALHAAYRKVGKIEGRKAIILLSDGDDSSSQLGFKRVLEEAKANNTMIFSIGLGGGSDGAPRKDVLRDFSESTGGAFFYVESAAELAGAYEKIAQELRSQIYVTYATTNEKWDGRWMKLEVETSRPGIKLRSRSGYFAVRLPAGGA